MKYISKVGVAEPLGARHFYFFLGSVEVIGWLIAVGFTELSFIEKLPIFSVFWGSVRFVIYCSYLHFSNRLSGNHARTKLFVQVINGEAVVPADSYFPRKGMVCSSGKSVKSVPKPVTQTERATFDLRHSLGHILMNSFIKLVY